MVWKISGVVTKIKKKNREIEIIHCCSHRQALAVKRIPHDLKSVMDDVVKLVNLVKSRSLNSRLFTILCESMENVHSTLLLHTEVRWLSRGKVLTRFFELHEEVVVFISDHLHEIFLCNVLL